MSKLKTLALFTALALSANVLPRAHHSLFSIPRVSISLINPL